MKIKMNVCGNNSGKPFKAGDVIDVAQQEAERLIVQKLAVTAHTPKQQKDTTGGV